MQQPNTYIGRKKCIKTKTLDDKKLIGMNMNPATINIVQK